MKKIQAFLVMGFVMAAALAAGFYAQVQEQKAAMTRVKNILIAVEKERDVLETVMNKRLQDKEKLISYLKAMLYKEELIVSKLTDNLERSGRRFQTAIRTKKPIELEKIIISSLLEAEGKVLAVDRQNDLVVINLGSLNNLKSGDKLSIYRGDNFIANAELVKVQDKISAAAVLSDNNLKDVTVEVNDIVK